MDFTREPIIETVITPREGCKLVVRSSQTTGQEEFFVEAVEVVSFGHSMFFRSLERPKTFLVPASDYEILEVREARMVLKNVGIERTIKIAGGREAHIRPPREQQQEVLEPSPREAAPPEKAEAPASAAAEKVDPRLDKKRDRRRQSRRRRGRDETSPAEGQQEGAASEKGESEGQGDAKSFDNEQSQMQSSTSILTSLLPPPSMLISETIARYKDNALFKDAFYSKEEPRAYEKNIDPALPTIPLAQPEYGSFEMSEDEEEEIYLQRKNQAPSHHAEEHAEDDAARSDALEHQREDNVPNHLESEHLNHGSELLSDDSVESSKDNDSH